MKQQLAGLATLIFFGALGSASASTLSGNLTISDMLCGSPPQSGVTVSLAAIDWLPTDGTTGCIQTGTTTSVTSAGGTLLPGISGLIKDLTFPGPNPVLSFMTFTGTPFNGIFDLYLLGPGVTLTTCVNDFNANDPACSVL